MKLICIEYWREPIEQWHDNCSYKNGLPDIIPTVAKGEERLQDLPPILVVDSQPDIRIELEQNLKRVGFPVESAADGFEALAMCKADKYSMVIAFIHAIQQNS